MTRPFEVRALVVRLEDERPWIAACMSADIYDIIDVDEWDEWKRKALEMVLPVSYLPHYEVREIVLRVPQADLDALFAVGPIDVETRKAS